MKHVSTSANDSTLICSLKSLKIMTDLKNDTMDFSIDSSKKNLATITKKIDVSLHIQAMVENSECLALQFVETNFILKNIEAQIGCFVNKL